MINMDFGSIGDFLGHKYFGIPLVLLIIGFAHLGFMATVLFGQTALELIEKKMSK